MMGRDRDRKRDRERDRERGCLQGAKGERIPTWFGESQLFNVIYKLASELGARGTFQRARGKRPLPRGPTGPH